MTNAQKKKADEIFHLLSTRNFSDFYGTVPEDAPDESPFGKYLRGDDGAPTKDDILQEIVYLFKL
jgi:hypothetical protein